MSNSRSSNYSSKNDTNLFNSLKKGLNQTRIPKLDFFTKLFYSFMCFFNYQQYCTEQRNHTSNEIQHGNNILEDDRVWEFQGEGRVKKNVTRGNVMRGNATRGNVTRGNATRGNVTRGNATRGNVTRGKRDKLKYWSQNGDNLGY